MSFPIGGARVIEGHGPPLVQIELFANYHNTAPHLAVEFANEILRVAEPLTEEAKEKIPPQYICMTCKTVIGPIWDDHENQCNCDVYEYEVWLVAPVKTQST